MPVPKTKEKQRSGERVSGSTSRQSSIASVGQQERSLAFFANEDSEAMRRDSLLDVKQFIDTMEEIRKILGQISTGQCKPEDVRVHLCDHFITLHRLNKFAQYRNKQLRDKTNDCRAKLDERFLRLQNLLCEVGHLQAEANRCLQFKSAHESIELSSVDEFFNRAPSDLIEASQKTATHNDAAHSLRLARLTWELQERQHMASVLDGLQNQRASLQGLIDESQQQLDSLHPALEEVIVSARSVQKVLGHDYEKENRQRQLARCLVAPLFLLYQKAKAFQYVDGKDWVSVLVCGQTQNVSVSAFVESPDDSGDSDNETLMKNNTVNQSSADADIETVLSIDSRRRLGLASAKLDLMKTEPLYVQITILFAEETEIILEFYMTSALEAVTVKADLKSKQSSRNNYHLPDVLNIDTILTTLMDLKTLDTGLQCSSLAGQRRLQRAGLEFPAVSDELGRTFQWAQALCGLTDTPLTIDEFLNKLRNRVNARIALKSELHALDGNNVCIPDYATKMYPSKLNSRLSQFKSTTREEACHRGINDSDEYSWFFQATICNSVIGQSNITIILNIALSFWYPDVPPSLSVNMLDAQKCNANFNSLRAIERYLCCNVWPSLKEYHLSMLIKHVLLACDVLMQQNDSSAAHWGLRRLIRGRDRLPPLIYNDELKTVKFF